MEGAEGAGRMGLESDQRALFGRKKEEEWEREGGQKGTRGA